MSILAGVLAVRSYREETMMQTMPSVPATVLASEQVRGGALVQIVFRRISGGDLVDCQTQIRLMGGGGNLAVGSIVEVIPRSYSCGEPVIVGPRNTTILASASGAFFFVSLVLAVLAAHSMPRSRQGGAPE